MGNWKYRPRRRFYRQDNTPRFPPSYHQPESEPSLAEFRDDGVPLWEKKFCTLVGLVSWRKIVDAKKFVSSNDNVLSWNDSAGEEAFRNAKERYWAEINGRSCDISTPDPDAYIDRINWNPYIDPELVRDLELEYYAPNDGEKDGQVGLESATTRIRSSAPSEEGCSTNPCKVDNPWECDNDNEGNNGLQDLLGWGHLNNDNNNGEEDNPWENSISRGNQSIKHDSWGYNGSRDWNTGNNSWGNKDDGWGDFKRSSWGRNQWDANKLPKRDNSWGRSFVRHVGAPNDQGWVDCGRSSWDRKQWENHNIASRKLDYGNSSSTGGAWHGGSRKREGSERHISGYKSSRFQRNDNQTSHCWRSGKPNKRGSFAHE